MFGYFIFFSSLAGSPTSDPTTENAIILGVTLGAGTIILVLLIGIVVVCLLIFQGVCPRLKKQFIDNVQLMKMKQNGKDDAVTVITEGNMTQNAKHYHQPDIELTPEKNSYPFPV